MCATREAGDVGCRMGACNFQRRVRTAWTERRREEGNQDWSSISKSRRGGIGRGKAMVGGFLDGPALVETSNRDINVRQTCLERKILRNRLRVDLRTLFALMHLQLRSRFDTGQK